MAECRPKAMPRKSFRHRRIGRFIVGRPRLLLSTAAGVLLFALLPGSMRLTTQFILAWDLTTLLYLGSTLVMISRSTVETCQSRASLYDEGDWIILLLVLTVITVALSWAFTHMVFTLHYANVYYKPDEDGPGGLKFPGHREPDYRDFLYYAFVIGCASQTGDVATVSRAMRRLTLVHGIVAFAFNTAILALMINVGASMIR